VFGEERITDFLALLENKFCGDWILRETPTTRIENMNAVIKKTDEVHSQANSKHAGGIELLLQSGVFAFDITKFVHYLMLNPFMVVGSHGTFFTSST